MKHGERIARCGNSGNTSEPYDGKGFFTSAGLLVVFDGIKTGYAENYDKLDPRKAYIPHPTKLSIYTADNVLKTPHPYKLVAIGYTP